MFGHRPLPLGFAYPYDWGFVPGTKAADGDPWTRSCTGTWRATPGSSSAAAPSASSGSSRKRRPAGASERPDLALPLVHFRGARLRTHADIDRRVLEEIEHFFTSSVFFEPRTRASSRWEGPEAAEQLLHGG